MQALRRTIVAGVAIALMLSATNGAVAEDDGEIDQLGRVDVVELMAYPYLPNGEMIDQFGPWHGSITVQNVEDSDVRIWALTDAGFEPDDALGTWVLPPNGSITLSAQSLGLTETGSPVVIAGMFRAVWDAPPEIREDVIDETCGVVFGAPDSDLWEATCKPSIAGVARMTSPEPMSGATGNRTTDAHQSVDGYSAIPAQDIAWGSQSAFCDAVVANWPGDCSGIGTYEPLGYGVGFVFDGHSYLPIVQTNSGWNTEIRVSNIDPSVWAGQVNVTLIASSQDGHAPGNDREISFEETLRPGDSWALNLRDEGVPDGWVGSAHITSNVGVVAYAARSKPQDDMLMMNVAAPSTWATTSPGTQLQSIDGEINHEHFSGDRFQMHAPLVFRDYFGWNTGINIANIDEASNRVQITWYDGDGNIRAGDVKTIPARGQAYVHIPGAVASADVSEQGWVGSVTLEGDQPFHAVIDQVKYETGEAMSYMATAAGARSPENPDAPEHSSSSLALPIMTRGLSDGSGDTSGLQLFNPDSSDPVEIELRFYSPVGDLLDPTKYAPMKAMIRPRGHYTFYTMNMENMIPNSPGSVRIDVVGGKGTVYGVSNLVNYAVDGDGSTAYNLVNEYGQYRFPVSQTELP